MSQENERLLKVLSSLKAENGDLTLQVRDFHKKLREVTSALDDMNRELNGAASER